MGKRMVACLTWLSTILLILVAVFASAGLIIPLAKPDQVYPADLPKLTWVSPKLSLDLISNSPQPIAIASSKNGKIFGVFILNNKYILRSSNDLLNWTTVNDNIIQDGYSLSIGRDLALTNHGVVLISATRMSGSNNFTIFEASFDFGKTFDVVMNVSLKAISGDGPGRGFWHGVAETRNGTLFAGLYCPQGLVYRSLNSGHSWTLVFNASSLNGEWQREIHDVQVDPKNDFVYVVTDDETGQNRCNATIWASTDYGDYWSLVYSMINGGAGLPTYVRPLAIGFIKDSKQEYMILGLDSMNLHKLYLLQVKPSGDLEESYLVSANESAVDPFYTWWIQPLDNLHVFALSKDSSPISKLGAGLFIVSSEGTLDTLIIMNSIGGSPQFLSMASLPSKQKYGVIAATDQTIYLLVFSYPVEAIPEYSLSRNYLLPLLFFSVFGALSLQVYRHYRKQKNANRSCVQTGVSNTS